MIKDAGSDEIKYYSRHLMCPDTGISYREPAPHSFLSTLLMGHVLNVRAWAMLRQ